mmetsp:Transcript_29775/g.76959  ORF Transcript_29775/g.76959 Transcript_29775/m.76959 type:complete len:464 (+) Transcript_29775:315-1706(+)|eukprot:jgi/Tetstr1/432315/TSEL_021716.t1
MHGGSGPLLGATTPTARQRAAAKRKRNCRIGAGVAVLVLLAFFGSLFLVDLDAVGKQAAEHQELQVHGGHHAPRHLPRPNHSLVKPRERPDPVPHSLRIYIYGDAVPPALNRNLRGKESCWHGYTGLEALLPELVAASTAFTPHGDLADFYLVPILPECFLKTEMHRGLDHTKAHDLFNDLFAQTMDAVQARFPYWAATEGRDHLFVFPSERGAAMLSHDNMLRIKKSILITGLQRRDPEWTVFNPSKDIVVPPAMSVYHPNGAAELNLVKGLGTTEREYLLYFRGVLPGIEDQGTWGLRATLFSHLQAERGVLFRDSKDSSCDRACSLAEMTQARYCLAPEGGVEGWSLRIFDSILQGCIPVIVADSWELPFQETLDWSKFSIKVLEKDADEVVELLRSLPQSAVEAKAAELGRVAQRFRWHAAWERDDAFDTLLRQLDGRVRFMRNSPYRYWREPVQFGRR